MGEIFPLRVYFDASCGLCNSEMQAIKAHDVLGRLKLIDCSARDFDDAPFRHEGISRADMMRCLHVCDGSGRWIKGVAAFELLYRTVGMPKLAALWGGRYTRPIMESLYPRVARHRRLLSWSCLPLLFLLMGKCQAWRAYRHSRRCSDGGCSIGLPK